MIKGTIIVLCTGLFALCFAIDETVEPPLKYTLKINNEERDVTLDSAVKLKGNYKNPVISLSAGDTRYFSYGNVAFKYPASFTWEAEIENSNEKTWTLSGNDFKIMYFVQPEILTLESYALAMAEQFGKESTRISNTDRVFGKQALKGKLLFIKLAGVGLTIEAYLLPTKSGSRLIVLQDNPSDNRVISKEGERALKLLSDSFVDKESAEFKETAGL